MARERGFMEMPGAEQVGVVGVTVVGVTSLPATYTFMMFPSSPEDVNMLQGCYKSVLCMWLTPSKTWVGLKIIFHQPPEASILNTLYIMQTHREIKFLHSYKWWERWHPCQQHTGCFCHYLKELANSNCSQNNLQIVHVHLHTWHNKSHFQPPISYSSVYLHTIVRVLFRILSLGRGGLCGAPGDLPW